MSFVGNVECCASGHFDFSGDSQTYLGQIPDQSSFVTELYAQAVARIFILQQLHKYIVCSKTPICIVYDNKGADILANSVKKAACQPVLSRMCQALDLLIRSLYPNLSSQHVYSHDKQPWNEFADSLCTFARFRRNNQTIISSIVAHPINSHDVNALFSFVIFNTPTT